MRILFAQAAKVSPRNLLCLDAVGALVTCLLIGVVLASNRVATGLPTEILWLLAALAGILFVTSLTSSLFAARPAKMLKYIAIANLSYCVLTLTICVIKLRQLTIWGLIYFSLEAAVIILLASWEWRVAKRNMANATFVAV